MSLEEIQHRMSHVLKAISDEAFQKYFQMQQKRITSCRTAKENHFEGEQQLTGGLRFNLLTESSAIPHIQCKLCRSYPYIVSNLCLHFSSVSSTGVEQEDVPKV